MMLPYNVGYVFFIVFYLAKVGESWKNGFDKPLDFTCPVNKVISTIRSIHENWAEDRRWDFNCIWNKFASNICSWSGYVNSMDQTFAFQCPGNGYIAGVHSIHENWAEDRRFKFYCCQPKGKAIINRCHYTSINWYDQPISHNVPHSFVWRGVVSNHADWAEDRQFVFEFCNLGN